MRNSLPHYILFFLYLICAVTAISSLDEHLVIRADAQIRERKEK
jgi:hypothetical protein